MDGLTDALPIITHYRNTSRLATNLSESTTKPLYRLWMTVTLKARFKKGSPAATHQNAFARPPQWSPRRLKACRTCSVVMKSSISLTDDKFLYSKDTQINTLAHNAHIYIKYSASILRYGVWTISFSGSIICTATIKYSTQKNGLLM